MCTRTCMYVCAHVCAHVYTVIKIDFMNYKQL
jgi:hypothetical protein